MTLNYKTILTLWEKSDDVKSSDKSDTDSHDTSSDDKSGEDQHEEHDGESSEKDDEHENFTQSTNQTNQTKQCPSSCDDGNPCTNDLCSVNTNFVCVHNPLNNEQRGCSGSAGTCRAYSCVNGACTIINVTPCENATQPATNQTINKTVNATQPVINVTANDTINKTVNATPQTANKTVNATSNLTNNQNVNNKSNAESTDKWIYDSNSTSYQQQSLYARSQPLQTQNDQQTQVQNKNQQTIHPQGELPLIGLMVFLGMIVSGIIILSSRKN